MKSRNIYADMPIAYKILVPYILITVICICIMSLLVSSKSTSTIRELLRKNVEQVMTSTYTSMTEQISSVNTIFTTLQANHRLRNALIDYDPSHAPANIAVIESILSEADTYHRKTSSINLFAINHPEYPVGSSDMVFPESVIKNTYYYNTLLEGGTTPKWIANDNNYSSKSSITAFKLMPDIYTGEPLAIIRIDIDVSQFVSPLQNLNLSDGRRLFVSTSSTHILNPYQDNVIAQFSQNGDLINSIRNNKSEISYIDIGGAEYMMLSYPLRDTGFYLTGAIQLDKLYKEASSTRTIILLTAILMMLMITVIICYISFYVTKPIVNLSKEMDRYTLEGRTVVVPHPKNDEISNLYKSFTNMQERIYDLTNTLKKSLEMQKKIELKAIQAQISPHFLYNTLNSISALAQIHNINDIERMTTSLATFFTRTLNNGNTFCSIRNELIHIKSYIDIQNIRFSNKFNIHIDIPDEMLDCQIINLTLQPLVENCIVHGFKNKPGTGDIFITGRLSGNDIYIDVADNGQGANMVNIKSLNQYVTKPFSFDEQIEKYGIHNVNTRIQLYYGEEYGLCYSYNEMDGITATVHFSTHKKEDKAQ